jgi:hypothetical protein
MQAKAFLAAGIAVLSFGVSHAQAETLYGVDYPVSATLYTVNETTGALTTVGPVGLDNVGDLTSDLVSKLWGIQITTNSLVSINPSTGAGTLGPAITGTAGSPAGGPGFPIVSLAYDPLNATLYGNTSVSFGGATADELYSINTTTGAATTIGFIGENEVYALGFSQAGSLYGVDGNCNLLNINTATGAGAVVGSTGLAVNGGCGVFDIASGLNGTMYLADDDSESLYNVNLGTGGTTLIGPFGSLTNVVGLAVLATPEPGTVMLFATGVVVAWLGTRRRKHLSR